MAADLDSAFAFTEEQLKQADKALEDRLNRQLWAFVLLMAWTVVGVSIAAWMFDWEFVAEPAKFLVAMLSSVMLPVVTLVIGYYFGSK